MLVLDKEGIFHDYKKKPISKTFISNTEHTKHEAKTPETKNPKKPMKLLVSFFKTSFPGLLLLDLEIYMRSYCVFSDGNEPIQSLKPHDHSPVTSFSTLSFVFNYCNNYMIEKSYNDRKIAIKGALS